MKQMDRIEEKLGVIDQKLDDHLGRLSKAESSIEWLKGYTKIGITLLVAAFMSAVGYIFQILTTKG